MEFLNRLSVILLKSLENRLNHLKSKNIMKKKIKMWAIISCETNRIMKVCRTKKEAIIERDAICQFDDVVKVEIKILK